MTKNSRQKSLKGEYLWKSDGPEGKGTRSHQLDSRQNNRTVVSGKGGEVLMWERILIPVLVTVITELAKEAVEGDWAKRLK